MPNRYGQFYGYTGLFPILEEVRSESHTDELRGILAALPNGAGSLFARTGLVHAARLFVIDDVIYNGAPSLEEHLAYSYLALSMTMDGDVAALGNRLSEVGGEEFGTVFSHCYGYKQAGSIPEYLNRCQIETTFLYVDLEKINLEATLRALAVQRLVPDMIERAQGLGVAARKAIVREFASRLSTQRSPELGTMREARPDMDPQS